jgi:hypothetical protein
MLNEYDVLALSTAKDFDMIFRKDRDHYVIVKSRDGIANQHITKTNVLSAVEGRILTETTLFDEYLDQHTLFDVCLDEKPEFTKINNAILNISLQE